MNGDCMIVISKETEKSNNFSGSAAQAKKKREALLPEIQNRWVRTVGWRLGSCAGYNFVYCGGGGGILTNGGKKGGAGGCKKLCETVFLLSGVRSNNGQAGETVGEYEGPAMEWVSFRV